MIKLLNVAKTFTTAANQVEAVKNATLTIEKGEIFGIIGFSGAGKSTLIRCINLLEKPTSGKVIVDGKDLMTLSEKQLRHERKKIGMIFQHFNLMRSRTVKDNIAYPLKGSGLSKQQIEEKVDSLLKLVELEDKKNAYPSQLSGGQKQRVAIARSLANDPKVLLCDEATSALDPQTTQSILKLLKEVNKQYGLTIVLITHEMGVIKEICDRAAIMENGEIREHGSILDIFANPREQVTQNFIATTSNLNKLEELVASKSPLTSLKPGQRLVLLSYSEGSTSQSLISDIAQLFGVKANIIFGNVEIISNAPLGRLAVILDGESVKLQEAVRYLEDHDVKVEELKA